MTYDAFMCIDWPGLIQMYCLWYLALVLALVLVQVLVQVQVQALVLQLQQQKPTHVRYVHVTKDIVMCCKTACFESL
jgi:hypothetical protein